MPIKIEDLYITKPSIDPIELESVLKTERRQVLFYDIETRPSHEDVLQSFFDESSVSLPPNPGKFDSAAVKYGAMKDPEKKAAKLSQKKREHADKVAGHSKACEIAIEEAWNEHVASSTLCPSLGRVLAIGYGLKAGSETQVCLDIEPVRESSMLLRFWKFASLIKKRGGKLVSFNGHGFDLPFLTRRSWAYEYVKPLNLRTKYNKFEDCCIDVAIEYRLGQYGSSGAIKLDKLAQTLGVRRKLEGMTGDMFHSVYNENPETAREYLTLDILVLSDIARRMNLV